MIGKQLNGFQISGAGEQLCGSPEILFRIVHAGDHGDVDPCDLTVFVETVEDLVVEEELG